jgi:Tfp pilus assembly protein PilO
MQSIRIVFLILFVVIVLLAWMYHKDTQEKRHLQQLVGKQPLVKSPRSDSELAGVQSAQFGRGLTQIEIKQEKFDQLLTQLHKKVIGMDGFVHALVVNLLVGGHLLVE